MARIIVASRTRPLPLKRRPTHGPSRSVESERCELSYCEAHRVAESRSSASFEQRHSVVEQNLPEQHCPGWKRQQSVAHRDDEERALVLPCSSRRIAPQQAPPRRRIWRNGCEEEPAGLGDAGKFAARCVTRASAAENVMINGMQALKAHVRNGHFVSDEPTDLPEGTEVELQLVNVADPCAGMTPKERAEFETELAAGYAEADAGELIDADDVLAKLRAPA